jgi:hypothetical protein
VYTVSAVDDETPMLLPQRIPGAEPAGIPHQQEGADRPRGLPDVEVLRQVLAGLRRLD